MGQFDAFGEMERAGWTDATRAAAYVDLFAAATDQVIPQLIGSVDAAPGARVLDLCCGHGGVAGALVARGCEVVGADFSPAMLGLAEQRVPGATFVEADAQALPFADGDFDAVVSNLGIPHVPDQPRALAEVRRVLRRGGRFGMTVWCGPDRSPAFAMLYDAVATHGHPDVAVARGPDTHQFADQGTATELLVEAGFAGVEVAVVDCRWELTSPGGLAEIYQQATVRASSLLADQPKENLAAIRTAMAAAVRERFAHGDRWRVPMPAALVKASVRAR